MKKISNLLGIVAVTVLCLSCQPREKIVEYPVCGVKASRSLEIIKVVINDTATIVYAEAYQRPKYWIRVDSNMYIREGENKYQIVSTEGIPLNDYYWMPDSGKCLFKMFFSPIKRSAESIDLMEGADPGGWHIWDIELKKNAAPRNSGIPEAIRNQILTKTEKLSEPELIIGRSKVNVHLVGYRKEIGSSTVNLLLNSLLTSQREEYSAEIGEDGKLHFEFDQYGTAGIVIYGQLFHVGPMILAPGEETDVYVDMVALSRAFSKYPKDKDNMPIDYSSGKYGALNNVLLKGTGNYGLIDYESLIQAVNGMNADEYVVFLMGKYREKLDTIEQSDEPEAVKEYYRINLGCDVADYIGMGRYYLQQAYRKANNINYNTQLTDYKAPEFTAKNWEVLKELNLNNNMIYYIPDAAYSIPRILSDLTPQQLAGILGTNEGTLFDLQKIEAIPHAFRNMERMTDSQKNTLDSIRNPFYKEAMMKMERNMLDKIEADKHKTGYKVCEVPKVNNKALFDAIISPYKGKVVFVDFWATWCGPCCSSIKQMEPLKNSAFKEQDIAFVYLTGESSPLGTWKGTIPDIKGDHYRVSDKQWGYLCDQFKIDGIPSYVLVSKDGTYKLRNDLRDHAKLKKVLLQEAAK